MQYGVNGKELLPAATACVVCGACNSICPQNIDLVSLMLDLKSGDNNESDSGVYTGSTGGILVNCIFIPGSALQKDSAMLERVSRYLNAKQRVEIYDDVALDVLEAVESGGSIPKERLEKFLSGLTKAKKIIVDDGLLLRCLRDWLPERKVVALGYHLSKTAVSGLRENDLYIVNARAFHADVATMQAHYAAMQSMVGCYMNLDLQRLAQPTLSDIYPGSLDMVRQIHHIIEGRDAKRVVVESLSDQGAFSRIVNVPVIHVAELFVNG